MDDLKSVTVSYLRNLARKHLGPGYSKLRKRELIAALVQFVPVLKKVAQWAGIRLPSRAEPAQWEKEPGVQQVARKKKSKATKGPEAKKATEPKKEPEKKAAPPQSPKPVPGRLAAAAPEELPQSPRPAQVVNFPPRQRVPRSAEVTGNEQTAPGVGLPQEDAQARPAEPLLEGFFVARVRGERELRRHHIIEELAPRSVSSSNATGYEENLGELPVDYASDVAWALARDPHTLFISWDFGPATRVRAMEGLDAPRPILRVYDGDKLVRVEEFALESRSFYIHGLAPGRSYRVEAHFVGQDGRSRRIGPSTHPVLLPQAGVSPDTEVRFMRMPPPPPPTASAAPQPLVAPAVLARQDLVEEHRFITLPRVRLPSSVDMAEVVESRRERTQRMVPRLPPGGYLESPGRPLGASEQLSWTAPPSGRGR